MHEPPLGDDVEVPEPGPSTSGPATRSARSPTPSTPCRRRARARRRAGGHAPQRRRLLVNLGRRNQDLLKRQLDAITELEANETDPDALASLFRLDHLATRMRRNAESLLVLAGIDAAAQVSTAGRLTDVIRAALGEVEDYERVTVRNGEPAAVDGLAAADLAHLLAEFDRERPHVLAARPGASRSGATPCPTSTRWPSSTTASGCRPRTSPANRRLAKPSAHRRPSKYLGLYVAGSLAARHGIHLTLGPSPGTGVTATIELPGSLLTADTAVPDGTPSHPARQGAAAALANASSNGSGSSNGNGNGEGGDGVAPPPPPATGRAGPGRGVRAGAERLDAGDQRGQLGRATAGSLRSRAQPRR